MFNVTDNIAIAGRIMDDLMVNVDSSEADF